MKRAILYSRLDCPLCEFAESMLAEAGVQIEWIDIDRDEAIRRVYHVRVPVLRVGDVELNWPFTAEQARGLL